MSKENPKAPPMTAEEFLHRVTGGLWQEGADLNLRQLKTREERLALIADYSEAQQKVYRRDRVAKLKEENARLRQFLWLSHGCTYTLYGDDGEMQCNETRIHRPLDFKRDSVEKLIEALRAKEASKANE